MTKTVSLDEIPYSPDGCELFERVRELPGAVYLDSSHPHSSTGRYDIITADPVMGALPVLDAQAGEDATRTYFSELGRFHRDYYDGIQPASEDIPFGAQVDTLELTVARSTRPGPSSSFP